jgi:hypothetical protein
VRCKNYYTTDVKHELEVCAHYTTENLADIGEKVWTCLKGIDVRPMGHVACILPWCVSILEVENVSSAP